jgi:hypothetical protein
MSEHSDFEIASEPTTVQLPHIFHERHFKYDPYLAVLPNGLDNYLRWITSINDTLALPFLSDHEPGLSFDDLKEVGQAKICPYIFGSLLHAFVASSPVHLGRYVWARIDVCDTAEYVFWATSNGYYARHIEPESQTATDIFWLALASLDTNR